MLHKPIINQSYKLLSLGFSFVCFCFVCFVCFLFCLRGTFQRVFLVLGVLLFCCFSSWIFCGEFCGVVLFVSLFCLGFFGGRVGGGDKESNSLF